MEVKKEKLYMPTGITRQKEYAKGFSKTELVKTLKVSVVFVILAVLVYVISGSLWWSMVVPMSGIPITVMMLTKADSNISPADYIAFMLRFTKEQKRYDYVYRDEWSRK